LPGGAAHAQPNVLKNQCLSELCPVIPKSSKTVANQITQWRNQLLEGAADVFGGEARPEPTTPTVDIKTLHAKIGQLTLENDFLEGALSKAGLLSAKR
jgi:transposase-like protein